MLRNCTRMKPLLRCHRQARADRISLDVRFYFVELELIPDPVAERLILPERLPRSPKHRIGLARGLPFDRSGDLGQFDSRSDEKVSVVWHDHESMQLIPFTGVLQEAGYNAFGDLRAAQPGGTMVGSIQSEVHFGKPAAVMNHRLKPLVHRLKPVPPCQAPGDKDGCTWGTPVGKVSPVHFSNKVVHRGGDSHA
jgi:hypothetical protein